MNFFIIFLNKIGLKISLRTLIPYLKIGSVGKVNYEAIQLGVFLVYKKSWKIIIIYCS